MKVAVSGTEPISIKGTLLPSLLLNLSERYATTGSETASNILPIIIVKPINPTGINTLNPLIFASGGV